MSLVYLLTTGHGDATIVRDLNSAYHHVARMLCPTGDYTQVFGRLEEYPNLNAAGSPGSFYHRVRYGVEEGVDGRGFEQLSIVTHNINAAPGMSSEVDHYDLVSEPDPSYEVQRALFIAEETDTDLAEVMEELEERVTELLDKKRFNETDKAFVARLRRYQEAGLGPQVIPADMTDKQVLKLLPGLAVEAFQAVALKAFPDDPALADLVPAAGAAPRR